MNQVIPPQTGADAQAGSPMELGKPALKDALKRTGKEMKEDRAALVSAGMAFYWFLALFPALLAAVGIIGLVRLGPEATADLAQIITAALPGDAAQILREAIETASTQGGGSLVAAIVGISIALWSASAGMVAMQQGLNVAYEVTEDRKFLQARLRALALLLATALLGGAATTLTVFGKPIGEFLRRTLPLASNLGPAWTPLWLTVRWVGAAAALLALFAAFYYLAPNRDSPRWTWITPGGLLGAGIWLVASFLFSLYVTSFGSYAETYGSLAGVVVLLLWLYLSALAVMLGGELNAELERASDQQTRPARRPAAASRPTEERSAPPSEKRSGGRRRKEAGVDADRRERQTASESTRARPEETEAWRRQVASSGSRSAT